jgi:hypothetical protein
MLAENLRLAYESQQAGAAGQKLSPVSADKDEPTISPAVKALIADEVKKQLAAEQAAAALATASTPDAAADTDQAPPALIQRFFVVSSNLELTAGGQSCSLSPGDIIQRKASDVSSDGTVAAEVVASNPGNCVVDALIAVSVVDLQEMQNQFRAQIDSGLKLMAENHAKGLPQAPATDARTAFTAAPAEDAEAQLASQEDVASKLEAEVRQAGGHN